MLASWSSFSANSSLVALRSCSRSRERDCGIETRERREYIGAGTARCSVRRRGEGTSNRKRTVNVMDQMNSKTEDRFALSSRRGSSENGNERERRGRMDEAEVGKLMVMQAVMLRSL